MFEDFSRSLNLQILANIASSDETLAYIMHESKDPEKRKWVDEMMDRSLKIKRWFRNNLKSPERELYLALAEGYYHD